MTEEEMQNFSQIVLEFHWPFDIYRTNILKKLNTTHYVIHVHGNNGPGVYNIHNMNAGLSEISIPQVFEVTYLNKKLFDTPLKKIHKNYPIDTLDYPNGPSFPEIEFFIPNSDTQIHIGKSNTNTKIIQLKEKVLIGHNLINKQNPGWKDMFEFKFNNNDLTVTRLDSPTGWGQELTVPIKHNKILAYNGFPFHYEMIGPILDFGAKYNIEVSLVQKYPDNSWIDIYKSKYKFNILDSLPSDLDHYLFVLLLTDDDMSFPDNLINENTVCIDRMNINRRPQINHHIPIMPFKDNNTDSYLLHVFNYVSYDYKINVLSKQKRPVISFVGNNTLPTDINSLFFIDNINDFDIYIINRHIPKDYINLPNVYLFENISANKLFELLTVSTYICCIPNNNTLLSQLQEKGEVTSGSIPLSFTTGCKLILPKEMNTFYKFSSIIEYSPGDKITFDKNPSLIETFNERERLMSIRDTCIFNLEHMKLYLECTNQNNKS
jgi:hypothetical protein